MRYPADFTHLDYVNPEAPSGGSLTMPERGSFDSFNAIIRKGLVPIGVNYYSAEVLLYDRLTYKAQDEPSTQYGLLAESVKLADDWSSIEFRLRPEARWHDGQPVTAEDVVYTFELIKAYGSPLLKQEFRQVAVAELIDQHHVRFLIEDATSPTPAQSVANMIVLPKHYWENRAADETTLTPPLGSGPYRVAEVQAGRRVVYERVADYWGREVPVMKGRHNFDRLVFEYFTNENVKHEAKKAGLLDASHEMIANRWASQYDFPGAQRGFFVKNMFQIDRPPSATMAIILNLRLPKFQDVRVREAITLALNFEWSNVVLYHRFYERSDSFFVSLDLAQTGMPSEAELQLLEPIRDQIPPRVFTEPYVPPVGPGVGYPREQLLEAARLLKEAGYVFNEGRLVHGSTGEPLTIDFISPTRPVLRSFMPYRESLKRLGIETSVRVVEAAQYQNRVGAFDFESTVMTLTRSLVPGWDLYNYYGSESAERQYSLNRAGIADPAVDYLIEKAIAARSREELIAATRALDRVMLWNFYAIPRWYAPGHRYGYWDKFGKPDVKPRFHTGFFDTWWYSEEKARRVETGMQQMSGSQ